MNHEPSPWEAHPLTTPRAAEACNAEYRGIQSLHPGGTPMQITLIQDARIVPTLCRLIAGAVSEIVILQYQFRATKRPRTPMWKILNALRDAAERGVKITILLNHADRPRRPGPSHGALTSWLDKPGIKILDFTRKQILHAKAIMVDQQNLLLGSHNFSEASFTTSRNISVLIQDTRICDDFSFIVKHLLAECSNGQS